MSKTRRIAFQNVGPYICGEGCVWLNFSNTGPALLPVPFASGQGYFIEIPNPSSQENITS